MYTLADTLSREIPWLVCSHLQFWKRSVNTSLNRPFFVQELLVVSTWCVSTGKAVYISISSAKRKQIKTISTTASACQLWWPRCITYFPVERVKSAVPFFHALLVTGRQNFDRVHIVRLDVLHQSVIGYGHFDHSRVVIIHSTWARLKKRNTMQTLAQQRCTCYLGLSSVTRL